MSVLQAEEMDILAGLVGWQLESLQRIKGSSEIRLRMGGIFRLHLSITPVGLDASAVHGSLGLLNPGVASSHKIPL